MSQPHVKPNRESTTSAPRWVKMFGIAALVLVLVFVILHLVDPDRYGPGMHTTSKHGAQQP